MTDDSALRATLEYPLGSSFAGLPVSRVGEGADHGHAHIRTYMVREPRSELYKGIRRVKGMFGVLVHVPHGDAIATAEAIAARIRALYRADETENTALSAPGLPTLTIREASVMSPYRGVDEHTGSERWLVCPVQIDWRHDITA